MDASERSRLQRRARLFVAWAMTALLTGVYFALPDGGGADPVEAGPPAKETAGDQRLEILDVSPPGATPGSAVTITHAGAAPGTPVEAFAGKEPLSILARRPGSIVARLPAEIPPGRAKLRVAADGKRSKPFDLRIKAQDLRSPFRKLAGGIALLAIGIAVLARGVREAAGTGSARTLARLARRRVAALLLGSLAGVSVQSTTAAAGLLAGLVTSDLLALGPAAAAFLGADLGAATAPLVTGIIDPRDGLIVVAIGALWLGLSADRRVAAIGRLLLGVGLIVLGLQTLRPGLEPFLENPTVLSVLTTLRADGPGGVALSALLGAALVAVFQGPGPVLMLVLVLSQMTTQWDLRTALAVLSGTGLGAAVGALLATSPGRRGRNLALLHLILGAASTLLTASTVQVWTGLADWVVPSLPHEIAWGKRILLPNIGIHLGVGFALSQLAAVAVLLPVIPRLVRWLERRGEGARPSTPPRVGDPVLVVNGRLAGIVRAYLGVIEPLGALALDGRRDAGRVLQHRMADARADLEDLLAHGVLVLPATPAGQDLRRAAFACLQLQRSLEGLELSAERFLDTRLAQVSDGALVLDPAAESVLREQHALLAEGLGAAAETLTHRRSLDLESARAREIRMNGLEAQSRGMLPAGDGGSATRMAIGVLQMADAYEACGNHLYRLAEALSDAYLEADPVPALEATTG